MTTNWRKTYVETAIAAARYAYEDLKCIHQSEPQQLLHDAGGVLLQLRVAVEALDQACKIARREVRGLKFRERVVTLPPDPLRAVE